MRSGTLIAGRYRLDEPIGEGRTGRVLRREAATAAKLDGDEWWLVMEHVPSSGLGTLIHAEDAMAPGRVARLGVRIVDHTYSLPTGKTKAESVMIAVTGGGETAERHCAVATGLAKALVSVLAARR